MIDLENIKELWFFKIDNEDCTINFEKIDIKSYRPNNEQPERYIVITDTDDNVYELDLALSARYDNKRLMLWKYYKDFVRHPEEYFFTKEDAQQRFLEVISYWHDKYEEELKEVRDKMERNQKILENYIKKCHHE